MHGKDAVIEEILDWRPYDIAQLDAELAARDADRSPEPELIRPRPGFLSGLQPLVIAG